MGGGKLREPGRDPLRASTFPNRRKRKRETFRVQEFLLKKQGGGRGERRISKTLLSRAKKKKKKKQRTEKSPRQLEGSENDPSKGTHLSGGGNDGKGDELTNAQRTGKREKSGERVKGVGDGLPEKNPKSRS